MDQVSLSKTIANSFDEGMSERAISNMSHNIAMKVFRGLMMGSLLVNSEKSIDIIIDSFKEEFETLLERELGRKPKS